MSHDELAALEPQPLALTVLDIVNDCDNFPYADVDPEGYTSHISTYYYLLISPCQHVLGYMLPSVALTLRGISGWSVSESDRVVSLEVPQTVLSETNSDTISTERVDAPDTTDLLALEKARSESIARTTHAMRQLDHFAILRKWRDELYPIYHRDPVSGKPVLLASVERSASPLFGIVTYGAHMTAFTTTHPKLNGEKGIWVAKRAKTKQTYPGMLDQTVAGGIATGETAFEGLVRESLEEASLPEDLVKRNATAVGNVTYFHIRDARAGGETRMLQPECQFVYDLDLSNETDEGGQQVEPRIGTDGEVDSFELLSVQKTKDALAQGLFKPNCALVMLDFFVRHGILTRENEPFYSELVSRLHRRLEFPVA